MPPKKKISIQEYNHHKAAEQQWAATYLDWDENGEDLDYEDFEPQDDPANIQIGYWTSMPVMQIPDLLLLQDALTTVPQPATIMVTPDVTIPMPQAKTGPGTIPGTAAHNVATVANQAPGFRRGLPVARASPMQVGTPVASALPMQIRTPAASASSMEVGTLVGLPHRTPRHGAAAEEVLLQGATLLCSPRQEANLLNPPLMLMDNHIKMMDTLCHLDTCGLQFICESVEALSRERTPTQAPLGYCMLQVSDTPLGNDQPPTTVAKVL